ncbi:MAG: PIN domain-containing protein [Cyanobacteriota bacterium]|nr:PIN domain-containing protein [Cyanobacteriota bacterium]
MAANDSLLFIDSNKYLDLYRLKPTKKLLLLLGDLTDYIFVTKQIVNEVQRNQVLTAVRFVRDSFENMSCKTLGLPDSWSSADVNQRQDIVNSMKEITKNINETNTKVDTLVITMMEQISHIEDEVSKVLLPIFDKAVPHSSDELRKARERKELGNPPGKRTDPLGDQLSWEQILTNFQGKKRLWIISSDKDYGETYKKRGFLNSFLYKELCNIVSKPEVYLFDDLSAGITDFVKVTEIKTEQQLSPTEIEEIESAEKSLPPMNELVESILRSLENSKRQRQQQFLQYAEEFEQRKQERLLQMIESNEQRLEERRRMFLGDTDSIT